MSFDRASIIEQPEEREKYLTKKSILDSKALLQAHVFASRTVIRDAGQNPDSVMFFDGGCAEYAGLSSKVHACEEMFFNPDGSVLTPEEYKEIITSLNNMTPVDRRTFRRRVCNIL